MKKKIFLLIAACMAIGSTAMAYDFSAMAPSGQILYYNISGSTVTVTYPSSDNYIPYFGYIAPSGDLTIPDSVTYNGTTYAVTSIGNGTFDYCSDLTSVTIPNSITSIGNYAFRSCSGLTSITIPNSVTSIGSQAFYNCSGLTSVTIGSGVTSIGDEAFIFCTSLTLMSTVSGNGVYDSRENCNAIIKSATNTLIAGCKNTIIPNSITSIGSSAFFGCSGLTSISIPNSVTSIGEQAFCYCSGLTYVTIPNSVTSIGASAFCDVRHIEYYGSATGSPWEAISMNGVVDGDFVYSDATKHNLTAYLGNGGTVSIPSSVESIGYKAFYGCSGLTSVTVPSNVTSIGHSAFYVCSSLTSVIFNADSCISAGSFDYPIFNGCINLTSITFGNNVRHIPDYLCTSCTGLTSVIFNADSCISAGSFDYPIFNDCINLTSITFGNSVRRIPDYLCTNCSGLTSVIIPNSVTSIGNAAFYSCSVLDTVYMMPSTPPSLGIYAFAHNTSSRVFILNGCSYYDYYFASSWYTYRSALRGPIIDFNVNVQPSNSARGTAYVVLGQGNIVRCDSTVVVQATANTGYHFDHWSNGLTSNPATITLTSDTTVTAYFIGLTVTSGDNTHGSATHTQIGDHLEIITATANHGYHFDHWSTGRISNPDTITLISDSTITAHFERNNYNLTVNVNDASLGTVATPQGTSALYQDTLMVVATPAAHHHVLNWQGQGVVATSVHKDTIWVKMDNNRTLTCNFAIDTHMVCVVSSDIIRGMVEASGTEFAYGTPCTVTATAYTGYTFAGWSNGVTANPYTFAVINDLELTALFVEEGEEVYTVTVESADPTMGTVSGGGQALSGGTVTISAIPNEGYRFLRWNDGNTENPRVVTVIGNVTYTASFESTQGIGDIDDSEVKIYAAEGRIVVESGDGESLGEVRVFDVIGRNIAAVGDAAGRVSTDGMKRYTFEVPTSGTYVVKIGNNTTRKIVVIK